MIDKQLDGKDVVVTFTHPIDGDTTIAVVGDFNDWSHDQHPMTSDSAQGTVSIRLAPGRSYRFRYLIGGTRWENDWGADRYEPNDFGGDDSVVDLTDTHAPATDGAAKKAPATKKAAAKKAPAKKAAPKTTGEAKKAPAKPRTPKAAPGQP
jgi:1,4-alpha-glucan branching enzyme